MVPGALAWSGTVTVSQSLEIFTQFTFSLQLHDFGNSDAEFHLPSCCWWAQLAYISPKLLSFSHLLTNSSSFMLSTYLVFLLLPSLNARNSCLNSDSFEPHCSFVRLRCKTWVCRRHNHYNTSSSSWKYFLCNRTMVSEVHNLCGIIYKGHKASGMVEYKYKFHQLCLKYWEWHLKLHRCWDFLL